MGMRADQRAKLCRQAVTPSAVASRTIGLDKILSTAFTVFVNLFIIICIPGYCNYQDAVHITAILGESVVFNCHVEFPGEHPVPYVLQWEKKVGDTGQAVPIYIWYDSYPTHSGEGYEGRVSRVSPDSPYGAASLNLTNIRESDQGWYECKVVFLNRSPTPNKNGTWFHLDVHAPPRFSVTPEDVIYVNLGDAIILNCQAEGTPTPDILWYKDANPVEASATIGIFNDGTELRISNIRHEDIGDYTCIARNGEGQISHTARVIIAGGAVIMVPPTNQTKLEGEKAQFSCEAKALPGNVTVKWFREGAPVKEVAALETRVTIRRDGSLVINPVSADDSGQYLCEVTNGIGEPQSASAYLNVEYPAKVTFTPTIQYLPFRLAGVVQCHIKANPPLQYVTWTKDKRLLEPYQTKDIVIMNNGSLLFTRVNQNHQGRYTCTPYNAHGTQGSSGPMEVLVRKPPMFTLEPESMYQRKVGETVDMTCDAQEAEGTQKPNIQWQRRDGAPLPKNRIRLSGGNITLESLRRSDFGFYQCVATNEVATIVTTTQLVVEGTQPHAPYNLSGMASQFGVTLQWLPGYSGGPDYKQDYTIWYREEGATEWSTIPVTPSGSTSVTINRLSPGTTYEFQVIGKNALGDGMLSKVITIKTLDVGLPQGVAATPTPPSNKVFQTASPDADTSGLSIIIFPTDSEGNYLFPPVLRPKGPKPGAPRNITVTEISNGFLIGWQQPLERTHLIQFYTIKYRTDGPWKTLNKGTIRPEETSYLVKNLVGGRTYYFRILANSVTSYESSEVIKYPVPARVKHKAITAGVVGGILFFIVAIILSVCAVKICNKRKRRKQEKAYKMVACRMSDARNGSNTPAEVPLKKRRQSRISSVTLYSLILNWIWPPDRCHTSTESLHSHISRISQYLDRNQNLETISQHITSRYHVGRIHRAPDGRFVLVDREFGSRETISNSSSSDDGGFLQKRSTGFHHASWRRPINLKSSQLSLRSDGTGQSGSRKYPTFLYTPQKYPGFQSSSPSHAQALMLSPWSPMAPMYISDLSSVTNTQNISDKTGSFSSGPRRDRELPALNAIREEVHGYTIRGSQEFNNSRTSRTLNESRYHRDPRFNTILLPRSMDFYHQGFVHGPRFYNTLPNLPRAIPWDDRTSMTIGQPRLIPRHTHLNLSGVHSTPNLTLRSPRSLRSPMAHEQSPESRSSSSGFASKNTSQQNQSSRSGSSAEWRLPPYKHPPVPYNHPMDFRDLEFREFHSGHAPLTGIRSAPVGGRTYEPFRRFNGSFHGFSQGQNFRRNLLAPLGPLDVSQLLTPPSPSMVDPWLDFTPEDDSSTSKVISNKVDVGSVDGHYEFDPASPTPTPSTPTVPPVGLVDGTLTAGFEERGSGSRVGERNQEDSLPAGTSFHSNNLRKSFGGFQRSRYDNIEARVQAMKEEFYQFRRRQAKRRDVGQELESAC